MWVESDASCRCSFDDVLGAHCLIFCRTNLDCDNLEKFLNAKGGGKVMQATKTFWGPPDAYYETVMKP